ncbi:hypothetical protein MPTK1_2g13250 [Marchantia polymorpha subsp. ruderalis]
MGDGGWGGVKTTRKSKRGGDDIVRHGCTAAIGTYRVVSRERVGPAASDGGWSTGRAVGSVEKGRRVRGPDGAAANPRISDGGKSTIFAGAVRCRRWVDCVRSPDTRLESAASESRVGGQDVRRPDSGSSSSSSGRGEECSSRAEGRRAGGLEIHWTAAGCSRRRGRGRTHAGPRPGERGGGEEERRAKRWGKCSRSI